MTAESPKYQGVNVNHPSIVAAIKNLIAQGRDTAYIARVVGMPFEVVRKHQEQEKKQMK